MNTRNAVATDAEKIADLSARAGTSVDAEAVRGRLTRILERSDHAVFVATDLEVVGWAHARSSVAIDRGSFVELLALVVAERFRRRGAGGHLMRRIEKWAAELGVVQLIARQDTRQPEGHSFFPAIGFVLGPTQGIYRKRLDDEAAPLT